MLAKNQKGKRSRKSFDVTFYYLKKIINWRLLIIKAYITSILEKVEEDVDTHSDHEAGS
jgi:hypothetical protein